MIHVLVVEDSRTTREYLVHILEADPALHVSTAGDGETALAMVAARRPDVILMDIHLPGIDGFETARRIMATTPVPIVVCTSSTSFDELKTVMRALELGALAAVRKPTGAAAPDAEADAQGLVDTLKLMSEVKVVRRWTSVSVPATGLAQPSPRVLSGKKARVIAIGASTGGPPVIAEILTSLPPGLAVPVLVVQHMARGFTVGFAEWLAMTSGLPVHVARDGESPLPGHVYVAPDDKHLRIGVRDQLLTTGDAPVNGLRPSVGALFLSVAERFGDRAIGVLLTGMGRDGAEELRVMSDRGALTVAQSEESCVVFGMPAEAIKLNAARVVLAPKQIAALLAGAAQSDGSIGGFHV